MATVAPLKIALVGGGLGGLAFAISCCRAKEEGANIEFTLFEGARKFAEIGAGIGMGENAFNVMQYLGLEKEYMEIGLPSEKCQWRFGEASRPSGAAGKFAETRFLHSTVHRAELLDIMAAKVPAGVAQFGKRLVRYEVDESKSSEQISLHFEDGSSSSCDVLVGGDGVHSVVRKQMYAGDDSVDPAPIYTGTTAARGILDMDLMKSLIGEEEATRPQMYLGKDSHILIFPIQQGKTVNVVAFTSDRSVAKPIWTGGAGVAPIAKEKLLEAWTGWSEHCVSILKAIEKPTQWALNELPDLPHYSKGSVSLLGDSAHAMLPHQGAGAAQAMEDGIILSALLCHSSTTFANVPHALTTYDTLRITRSEKVKHTSRELGNIMEFATSEYKDDTALIAENLETRYDWIWEWTAEEGCKEAVRVLLAK